MKKIFWTSLFWIIVCILFWAYVRFFNEDLGAKLSYCLMDAKVEDTTEPHQEYGKEISRIDEELEDIQNNIQLILEKLDGSDFSSSQAMTNTATTNEEISPSGLPTNTTLPTPFAE